MNSRWVRYTAALLVLLAHFGGKCTAEAFPKVRIRPLTLEGVWDSAPIVIVGNLDNIHASGTQQVRSLPWPAPRSVDRLYWCSGDLSVRVVIKGRAPTSGKRFVWATAKPGCELYPRLDSNHDRPLTRVWFVREEGNYIRPVVDGFGLYYLDLHAEWNDESKLDPQVRFAELLLSPGARGKTLAEFAQGFFTPAIVACSILGEARCVERINALAALGDPQLERAACEFVKSQFSQECARPAP